MNTLYEKFPFLWKIRRSLRFYRGQYHRLEIRRKELENKYYSLENRKCNKIENRIIVMIDGRFPHGGLTDRLRGCLSIYSYCKKHKLSFSIYFKYPFDLSKFLTFNTCDWSISDENISYNIRESQPFVLDCYDAIGENLFDVFVLNKYRKIAKGRTIHLYSNVHFDEDEYSNLFNELFKPTTLLQNLIDFHLRKIGASYISVTFRFQQLLGDFDEGDPKIYPILSSEEQSKLVHYCKCELIKLVQNTPVSQKISVTSDSITFLNVVSGLERIYVIPGKVVHMNFPSNEDIFIKSFIDLYLIMNARRVYLFKTGAMYNSGFPRFAAIIGNKDYIIHSF